MVFAHRFPDRVASVINVEGNFTLADAFWSSQLIRKTPGEVSELLEADRADRARWLRDGDVESIEEHIRSAAEALAYQPSSTVHAMARAVVEFTGQPGYEPLLREVIPSRKIICEAKARQVWCL